MENKTIQIPKDVKEMTKKYKIDKGGICGQSCLAVIEGITIKEVMNNWKTLGLEFKGWSGWKQLRQYLEKRGYVVKQLRFDKNKFWNMDNGIFYIARVQWLGSNELKREKPFYGYNHWSEASAHTHFIVISEEKFFCNEDGLFPFEKLKDYLKSQVVEDKVYLGGVITSLMYITKLEVKQEAMQSEARHSSQA
jgi:hypothetical protein